MINKLDYHESKLAAWLIKTFSIYSHDCHHGYNMIPIKKKYIFSHDCHH
jgi:hypothetical protein